MNKAYSSNLTAEQFALIEPLIPVGKPGGRPRQVCIWAVLNGILYVVVQGCKWRDLPADFPAWQTVYTYLRNWQQDGTWIRLHDQLRDWVRADNSRPYSPSEAIIDSQSVKTATMVHAAVGFDGGKSVKGRKRHAAVDTLGLLLRVKVTAASLAERAGAKQLLRQVHDMGDAVKRLYLIWADGGYGGQPFLQWVMDTLHWVLEVVLRPEQSKGFVLLKKRWVVERTFGWWNWYRRLSKDYERLPQTAETMIYLTMIRLMVRRLEAV